MKTAYLARLGIVTSPLIPQYWGAVMGNFDVSKWITAVVAIITLGVVVGSGLWGGGNWIGGQSKDVQALQGQVAVLQHQYDGVAMQLSSLRDQIAPLAQVPALIQRLNDRLDAAPRSDMIESRLLEIQRHLSALDGRGDATETRLRADEDRAIRDATRLDAIEKGSNTPLGNRR